MTHANAPLTPAGRLRLASCIVDDGWSLRRAAERFQVAPATAKRWADRYRAGQPLTDHSSRPAHSPNQLSRRTEHGSVNFSVELGSLFRVMGGGKSAGHRRRCRTRSGLASSVGSSVLGLSPWGLGPSRRGRRT